MSGAYVAKPAAAAAGPDTTPPPGWDLDWPFPGPFPPGYAPDYTFPITATEIIKVGDAAVVAGSVRDHVEFITSEPDAAVLSATIDGESISISPGTSIFGEGVYWNISDNATFGITRANEGQTIVLSAAALIGDEIVTGTANIVIYAHVYSLNLSGSEGIKYDEAASVTVTLRDHDTLATSDPGTALTWTATIDDAAVGLRFSGDTTYSSSIESVYSAVGEYYGAEEDIEFDLDEENETDTVVLKVESVAFDDDLDTTHEIEIEELYVVSFSASAVAGEWIPTGGALGCSPQIAISVYRTPVPTQRDATRMTDLIATWDPATAPWVVDWNYDATYYDQISENVCGAGGETLTVACAECVREKTYRIQFYATPGPTSYKRINGSVTFAVTVVLSDDTVETYSVVKNVVENGPNVGAQLLIEVDSAETTWTE